MRNFLRPTFLLCLLLLTTCKDITHVQTGYVADRDECRGRSENNVGVYSQSDSYGLSNKERNTALLQLFCECMKDKEWKVAGCPKPAAPVVAAAPATAPTVVVVQSPTAQPGFTPAPQEQPAPVATPVPVQAAGKKKRKVCSPPSTCPAPAAEYSTPSTPAGSELQLNDVIQRQ